MTDQKGNAAAGSGQLAPASYGEGEAGACAEGQHQPEPATATASEPEQPTASPVLSPAEASSPHPPSVAHPRRRSTG